MWSSLTKQQAFDWSRAHFPELRLNLRWSAPRLVATLRAYLATPQVALHYSAPAAPRRCAAAECSLNFAAPLAPGVAWRNAPGGLPPGAWGWADASDRAGASRLEGTPFVGGAAGAAYNPFAFSAVGTAAAPPVPAGDASAAARVAAGGAADGGVAAWTWEQGDGPAPGPLSHIRPGAGTTLASEVDGDNAYGTWTDATRSGWDVLPAVYDAIARVRAPRAGATASFAELAWVLASLQEVLLRADYLNATAPGRPPPAGPGEAVRLDDAVIAAPDPFARNASLWEAPEYRAYLAYAERYADAYDSRYLRLYLEQHAAAGG